MDPENRKARMLRMRKMVKEHNVYNWAGNLIGHLCELRLETPETKATGVGMGTTPGPGATRSQRRLAPATTRSMISVAPAP
jgi:trehalose-6-phosphate synthase